MASDTTTFDTIVVGSGITGGWAAKELSEAGLRTLLLERGRPVRHGADYTGEHVEPWDLPFRGRGNRPLYEREYPIQSQCYAFGEDTRHFFVNDARHPYLHDPDTPYSWIRGYHLGGRSITWARLCYRWSDLDFEANARDGFGVDWPIRYDDLAPWYDHVETFAGISGQPEGIPHLPDGKFLPPMPMNCVEEAFKERVGTSFPDRHTTIGRVAVLTRNHLGRDECHYCGPCHRGCSTGSYFSSLSSTLPAAVATGNLTIRTNSVVHGVMYDETIDRATGVRVIDALSGEQVEFRARVVFLCASALGSTQILLNSSTPRFPDGLANSSGALGHYLMDHPFAAGASAEMPEFGDKHYSGYRPNGVYIPRFQNLGSRKSATGDFLRGYALQGSAWREGWDRGLWIPGLGRDFKASLQGPGKWMMSLGGFGECLPRFENRVELDSDRVDEWGIPLLRIHQIWTGNELAMKRAMQESAAEMLEAAGGRNVRTYDRRWPPGLGIHEMGTARMGRDPATSVLNGWCQSHDVPNLFVTDGAAMSSSACQNPSITYMALTARACSHAIAELARGNI
jgi:choline dehydrogenase-like flavoprotein